LSLSKARQVEVKEEVTFFEKKVTKKTSRPAGAGIGVATARRTESFLLLFFKKEAFY